MKHVLWYMIYIIPKVWLCGILIHVHHKTTRGNAKHSTCKKQKPGIGVYTVCHSPQQSDQYLHFLPFSAIWSRSRSTLSFWGTVWSGSTIFAILSSLIKVNTICHSQQSYQGLHYLALSAVWSRRRYTLLFSGTVWSGYTQFAIRSSLIKVDTVCHSQQCDQGLHYLPFSAVWSGSTLFAILSSLIRV